MFREFGRKTSLDGVFVSGGRLTWFHNWRRSAFPIENATTSARACVGLFEDVHRI